MKEVASTGDHPHADRGQHRGRQGYMAAEKPRMRKAAFDASPRMFPENLTAYAPFPPVGDELPLVRGRQGAERLDKLDRIGLVPASGRSAEIESIECYAHRSTMDFSEK